MPIGVGFLSYDLGRRWIALPSRAADDHGWPALEFRFHDAVWVRDAPRSGRGAHPGARRRRPRAGWPIGSRAPAEPLPPPRFRALRPERRLTRATSAAVERILAYLVAGDAYQVNLARRLSAPIGPGDPVWLAAPCVRALPRRTRSGWRATAGATS